MGYDCHWSQNDKGGGGGGGGVGGVENGKYTMCMAELGESWDQETVMVFNDNHWTHISVLKSFHLQLPSHINYTQTVGIYQT